MEVDSGECVRNTQREQGSACVRSEVETTWNEWKDESQSGGKDTGFIVVVVALAFLYLWARLNNEYWCFKKSESLYSAAFIGF